jgi:hypothetical protein
MTPRQDSRRQTEPLTSKQRLDTFDTLIQSSTVALFHAYGVAVAPLTPSVDSPAAFAPDFPLGAISFRGPGMEATLIMSMPRAVRGQMRLGEHRHLDERDMTRELANQAMGRLKNRLFQYQVSLTCSLPLCADRSSELERAMRLAGPLTVYRFRTIHGHIMVALKGTLDAGRLVYSSTIKLNDEGDIILF